MAMSIPSETLAAAAARQGAAGIEDNDDNDSSPSCDAATTTLRQGPASTRNHGPRRATNACNVCRRLKMRCVVVSSSKDSNGTHIPEPPCQRCARVGHVCSFDESLSVRKTRKRRKLNDEEQLRLAHQRIAAMEEELKRQQRRRGDDTRDTEMAASQGGDDNSIVSSSISSLSQRQGDRRTNTISSAGSFTNATSLNSLGATKRSGDISRGGGPSSEKIGAVQPPDDEATYPLGLLAEASLHVAGERSADGPATAAVGKPRCLHNAVASSSGSTSATASVSAHQQSLSHPTHLRRRRRGGGVTGGGVGGHKHPFWVGNEPSPTSHEMITSGLVTWEEVETLYGMFFDGPAQHFLTLDADMHTLARIANRSSVLLTAVSAIGARFYAVRPSLHVQLYRTATRLAAMCVVDGVKSVEIVQALLLLCMWPLPSSHWTEDRAWMLSGLALRMATELGLHEHGHAASPSLLVSLQQQPMPTNGNDVSTLDELRNRQRVYLTCFAVDRSFSTLQGRNVVLPESRLTTNIRQWISVMPGCKPWDVGICSFIDLMRLMTVQLAYLHSRRDVQQRGTGSGSIDSEIDGGGVVDRELLAQVHLFDDQLDQWKELWSKHGLFDSISTSSGGAAADVAVEQWQQRPLDERLFISLVKQSPLRLGYAKLVINSFGLQHCLGVMARRADTNSQNARRAINDDSMTTDVHVLFSRCWRAARQVVLCALEGLRPVFRYAPASQLLVVCYAAVSLLKLQRHPLLLASVNGVQDDAMQLVVQVAELLDTIALDDSHTPALYASFLWSLIKNAQQQQQHGGGAQGGNDGISGQSGFSDQQEGSHEDTGGMDTTLGKATFDDQIVDALYADANFMRHHIAAPASTQQHYTEMLPESDMLLDGEGMMDGGGGGGQESRDCTSYIEDVAQDDGSWLQDDLLLGDDFWSMIAPVGLTHNTGSLMPLEWST